MTGLISLIAALYCTFFPVAEIQEQQETPEYRYYTSQLCQDDMFSFENRSIQFKKVVKDSRCPKGVTCIWAGNVKVLVEFFEGGRSLGTEIISGHDFEISDKFTEMEIELSGFEVTPYPSPDYKIRPEEYSINMKLRVKQEKG